MTDNLIIIPGPIRQPGPAQDNRPAGKKSTPAVSFDAVLDAKLNKGTLVFSRHAQSRMENRGIQFSEAEMARINRAVDQAKAKGARNSLVLLDNTALLVSVKNSTVVTVVDKDTMQGNVFTNIDSTVIA